MMYLLLRLQLIFMKCQLNQTNMYVRMRVRVLMKKNTSNLKHNCVLKLYQHFSNWNNHSRLHKSLYGWNIANATLNIYSLTTAQISVFNVTSSGDNITLQLDIRLYFSLRDSTWHINSGWNSMGILSGTYYQIMSFGVCSLKLCFEVDNKKTKFDWWCMMYYNVSFDIITFSSSVNVNEHVYSPFLKKL